jgi:hypothetical protein
MRLPFRQGLVQYPANCLQKINNDVVITTTNGPIIATIANRDAEYYHTEPQSPDPYVAWTGLTAGTAYWLYIDINKITAERTFGQTSIEPIDSATAPTNPVIDQHWFDTNTMTTKVWSGTAWGEYIRVFFAQITGTNSFTYNMLGAQVGIATSYNSGRILFDGFGKVIKQSNNSFMTTEDQFFVDGSSIQSARLESTVIAAIADENIPAFSVVTYSTFNAVKLARYEDISTSIVAIVTADVLYGAVTNIIMQGIVINPAWNWTSVNAPLWVDTFGQLTDIDPNTLNSLRPKAVPIARVLARDTIMFDQGMGGVGVQGPAGNATANVPVASTVVTGTVKLATAPTITNSPVVIGDNDPRLTNARPPISHTHPATDVSYIGHGGLASGTAQTAIDNLEDRKFNLDGGILTGPLTLAADPTTTLQAATKQYVDSRVSGLIWINTICLVNLISDSLNTPPITPAYSDVYIVATGAAGAWSGLSGRMVQWNGTSWNNLGDFLTTFGSTNRRLGISMESTTAASGTFAGRDNQIAIWTASTQTWSFYTPVNNNAVYVCNEASLHKYHQYVYDSASSTWLEFGGPQAIQPGNHLILTGNILSVTDGIGSTLNADMLDGQHASAFSLITHNHDADYVKISGSLMTGSLTLNANPTAALHAATKQYVDGQDLTKVNKAGDIMTGSLTLSADPVALLEAATKQYVDNATSNIQPAQQIVYGTGTGVTSSPSFIVDPTTGELSFNPNREVSSTPNNIALNAIGASSGSSVSGGSINITSGTGDVSGAGGNVTIQSAQGGSEGAGGSIAIIAGNGGGTFGGFSSPIGGTIDITAGSSHTNALPGFINLRAGSDEGVDVPGTGGSINIFSGGSTLGGDLGYINFGNGVTDHFRIDGTGAWLLQSEGWASGSNGDTLTSNGPGALPRWSNAVPQLQIQVSNMQTQINNLPTASSVPGGLTSQIQYNNGGVFAGASGITTNGTNLTVAGTLTLSGLNRRIVGDFTSVPFNNRTLVQTSTVNGTTSLGIIPNGTNTISNVAVFSSQDADNASIGLMSVDLPQGVMNIGCEKSGTGAYLPIRMRTNGVEQARLTNAGNLLLGTATEGTGKLQISGDLRIDGTGKKFIGDFNSATRSDRLVFVSQNAGGTSLAVAPNGAQSPSYGASFVAFDRLDVNNAAVVSMGTNTTVSFIQTYSGGATPALPLAIGTNNVERVRLTLNGNMLINTTTDNGVDKLQVNGSTSLAGILSTNSNIKVTNAQILCNNGTSNNIILDAPTGSIATTTGTVTVSRNPLTDFEVATKQYVDVRRELLTAPRTYYVATTGSDSNSGLAIGTPFLTIQKAVDVVCALDISIHNVTIQVADGTYTNTVILKSCVGSGTVAILGNATTPSNVLISTTSVGAFSAPDAGKWTLRHMKIQTTTSGGAISALGNTTVYFDNLNFGACASGHLGATDGARIIAIGNYVVSGGSLLGGHWYAIRGGTITTSLRTVTISNTPSFAAAWAWADRGLGMFDVYGMTFTGTGVTGTKYILSMNSVCFVNGAGINYLPGSLAGTTTFGAQYA